MDGSPLVDSIQTNDNGGLITTDKNSLCDVCFRRSQKVCCVPKYEVERLLLLMDALLGVVATFCANKLSFEEEDLCHVYQDVYNSSLQPPFPLSCSSFESENSDQTNNTSNVGYSKKLQDLLLFKLKAISYYWVAFYTVAVLLHLPHLAIFRFGSRKVLGAWIIMLHFLLAPLALMVSPIFARVAQSPDPDIVRWVLVIQVAASFIMMSMAIVIHLSSACKAKSEGRVHPFALLLPALRQTAAFISKLLYWGLFELLMNTLNTADAKAAVGIIIATLSYINVTQLMVFCILRKCCARSKVTHVYPELKEFLPNKKGCEGCDMKFAKERVITFTDGVLCIAATLVFVDLPTPDTTQDVPTYIFQNKDLFINVVLSVFTIFTLWAVHDSLFRELDEQVTVGMFFLNVLFCFFTTLVPISFSCLISFPDNENTLSFIILVMPFLTATLAITPLLILKQILIKRATKVTCCRHLLLLLNMTIVPFVVLFVSIMLRVQSEDVGKGFMVLFLELLVMFTCWLMQSAVGTVLRY